MTTRPETAPRGNILVLDDEENMVKILSKVLHLEGYSVTVFTEPAAAVDFLARHPADVLLTDIRMPGMTGREVLGKVRAQASPCEVVMMTAHGTIEGAIDCVKAGAFDYITKPFKTDELLATIARAMDHRRSKSTAHAAQGAPAASAPVSSSAVEKPRDLVGTAPSMDRVRDLVRRVAPSGSPVLIMGESGTGKELVARAVHAGSPRSGGRFVAINCASIPETLIESELFGHEKGAFTGASDTKIGLVEISSGGTLFLDEIGELPMPMQAKLLRVLQERELTRVGGTGNIKVDIRVVSATNRDLQKAIEEKTFREDLYYRLNVICIETPPLRDRREDIPMLAQHFLSTKSQRHGRTGLQFAPDAVAALSARAWPGNVRELENMVERLVVLAESDAITADLIPEDLGPLRRTGDKSTRTPLPVEEVPDFRAARDNFEREYLENLLRTHNGNVTEASRTAGMSRRNLYDKIEKLGIDLGLIKEVRRADD